MTNIALVVLDTLRKDAFDRHFDWLPGRRFEHAYSTANWTVPAHASLFTGRYPSEHGVHAKHIHFDVEEPTLAEQLSDAGYTTRGFSANPHISDHFGFERGFTDLKTPFEAADERLFDWREFVRTTDATGIEQYLRALVACIRGECATLPSLLAGVRLQLTRGSEVMYGGAEEALDTVRGQVFGEQEFLFINLMEAHIPYTVPDAYATVEPPELVDAIADITYGEQPVDQMTQAYDDCVRYLSDIYKTLFETLQDDFDYIITLSDHGDLFGEHGTWSHEHGVAPELTHVPLCISGPGMDGTTNEPVSIVDVHRTVLDIAGVDTDPDAGTDGGSDPVSDSVAATRKILTGAVEDTACLTEYLGLTPWSERKLRRNGDGELIERYNESLRGYAATGGYYGYETIDGFTDSSANTSDHDRDCDVLNQLVADLDVRHVDDTDPGKDVPDAVKDRLADLGYA